MAHRCIHRVHFSTGSDRKGCLIPKSASTKTAADKFDAYVSMFTMNYPSLSVLKCIRHFLRSLFWFSRHYAMAVSGYRYGRISRHVSRKAWLCKGSKILPFLLISSIRLKTSDSKQIPLFPLQVFDMPCRTAQHECTRIDLEVFRICL